MTYLRLWGALLATVFTFASEIQWEQVSPSLISSPQISDTAFGEGTFVAVGAGRLSFSTDTGASWHSATTSSTKLPNVAFSSVLYTNGVFVAVGTGNEIFSSDDGKTWEAHGISEADGFRTVIYGHGLWVAAGNNGLVATSVDGKSWSSRKVAANSLTSGAFGNDRFVIVETRDAAEVLFPAFVTSTDGTNWVEYAGVMPGYPCQTPKFCPFYKRITSLLFTNGQFVAQLLAGGRPTEYIPWSLRYMTSTNGTNWVDSGGEVAINPGQYSENTLRFINGMFVDPMSGVTSTNLVSWSRFSIPGDPSQQILDAAVSFGECHLVNRRLVSDRERTNLEPTRSYRRNEYRFCRQERRSGRWNHRRRWVGKRFFRRRVVDLFDERRFDFREDKSVYGPVGRISSVRYDQNRFVLAGSGGLIARSTNGVNWSKRLSNTSNDLLDLAYGSNVWVAVGANGTILSSADASSFSLRNSGTGVSLNGVTAGNGTFVAVGNSGAIAISTNGVDWTVQGSENAENLLDVTYGGGRFVAVGENGTVLVSTNEVAWTGVQISGSPNLASVSFADGLFLAIDSFGRNTGYLSSDGLQWESVTLPSPPLGTSETDGTVWISSFDSYMARATVKTATTFQLKGILDRGRVFTLEADLPVPGLYEILGSSDLATTSWQPLAVTNTGVHLKWTETNNTTQARFYKVRHQ